MWFARGLRLLPAAQHPPLWRQGCFVIGLLSFYIVLQTGIDYYAQHMFFVHRAAHFVLHHFGAFLIAMGMSGPVVYAGMPDALKSVIVSKPVQATVAVLQHPAIAPLLFVGLLYFWLIPEIHTRVMLDANLYQLMNWTMAVNGVMFWSLILDSRARPPARLSHLMRAALILIIELPQMVLGAILSALHPRLLSGLPDLRPGAGHDGAERPTLWRPHHLAAGHPDQLRGDDRGAGDDAAERGESRT